MRGMPYIVRIQAGLRKPNRTQKTSPLAGYPGGLSNSNANDQLTTDTYAANGNTAASIGLGYVYDRHGHGQAF